MLQTIENVLASKKVFEFSGVEPNPEIKQAEDAIKFARKNKVEFIIAAGGGSVIDFAKFLSLAYFQSKESLDLMKFETILPSRFLPWLHSNMSRKRN